MTQNEIKHTQHFYSEGLKKLKELGELVEAQRQDADVYGVSTSKEIEDLPESNAFQSVKARPTYSNGFNTSTSYEHPKEFRERMVKVDAEKFRKITRLAGVTS